MAKQQLNLRVSTLTLDQLKKLVERWGTSQTEAITVLIDRAYRQEQEKWHTKTLSKDNKQLDGQ